MAGLSLVTAVIFLAAFSFCARRLAPKKDARRP